MFSAADAQVLGSGDKVPGMINNEATITFEAKERPISDILDHIRSIVGVNVLLAPGIDDTITLKLTDVPWRDALDIVSEKAGCIVIEKSAKIFRVEKPPRVTFSFTDEDIKLVINAIAQSAGADVIIAPDVEGKVNMHVENIPWKDALENVIKTLGYHMVEEERGVLRVVTSA
jgi:type II secretory pathway component HofQ